ncbi:MAG: hypothetical protein IKI28_02855 [Bacteroidales bacterium]|nr:hypothetical protein [Bacteroidales bacterium]
MKFKIIERRRTAIEPELDATPYALTNDEQRFVEGGHECTCYGDYGNRKKSCKPHESGGNICGNRTWISEDFGQE